MSASGTARQSPMATLSAVISMVRSAPPRRRGRLVQMISRSTAYALLTPRTAQLSARCWMAIEATVIAR